MAAARFTQALEEGQGIDTGISVGFSLQFPPSADILETEMALDGYLRSEPVEGGNGLLEDLVASVPSLGSRLRMVTAGVNVSSDLLLEDRIEAVREVPPDTSNAAENGTATDSGDDDSTRGAEDAQEGGLDGDKDAGSISIVIAAAASSAAVVAICAAAAAFMYIYTENKKRAKGSVGAAFPPVQGACDHRPSISVANPMRPQILQQLPDRKQLPELEPHSTLPGSLIQINGRNNSLGPGLTIHMQGMSSYSGMGASRLYRGEVEDRRAGSGAVKVRRG